MKPEKKMSQQCDAQKCKPSTQAGLLNSGSKTLGMAQALLGVIVCSSLIIPMVDIFCFHVISSSSIGSNLHDALLGWWLLVVLQYYL